MQYAFSRLEETTLFYFMKLLTISCTTAVQAIIETTRSYHNTGKEQILKTEQSAF